MALPVKYAERMTISLPKPLAREIREHAEAAHGGKFSPAIAELAELGLRARSGEGVTNYALSSTEEATKVRSRTS